jgi:3-hydroxyisobutyrate dehydrogenase-like beta-hydroxyacid dehydrogenase
VSAGPSESIEKYRSLFAAMGQKTFMVSEDAPSANLIKLSGNFLTTTVIESLAEVFALMRKAGVDPQKFLEVLTGSMFFDSGLQNLWRHHRFRKVRAGWFQIAAWI